MRDEKLDVLRFIGLAMIILAHINPPYWIFQLRNFDVPLMVMISGVAFGLSYKGEVYSLYLWRRIKRLLFPTWLFLTAYFSVMYITDFPKPLPSIEKVSESYLLLEGIGYVWIIRVFLLVAVVAPFILAFNNKRKSNLSYFSSMLAIYIGYEILVYAWQPLASTMAGIFIENTIFYVVPYAIVFSLGLRFAALPSCQLIAPALIFGAIFFIMAAGLFLHSEGVVYTQAFKYPPQLYYLSYAMAVSFALWFVVDLLMPYIKGMLVYPFIEFIARNSLWAYLWHIPFVDLFNVAFYYKYPLVFLCACIMTCIQINFVSRILVPWLKNDDFRRNMKVLFTG